MADYMMASELIALLQAAVDEHGDMPVFKYSSEYGNQTFSRVMFVPGTNIYHGCSTYIGDSLELDDE